MARTLCAMQKLLLVAGLLMATVDLRAATPSFPVPKSSEVNAWFEGSGVRWAIYREYIRSNDALQNASTEMWETKRADVAKREFAKSQIAYLAGAQKELERLDAKWSESLREVLRITSLTRDEADRILGYICERQKEANSLAAEIAGVRRGVQPPAVKTNP
jgi:hypothetical protein